jgi:hypothetical protein
VANSNAATGYTSNMLRAALLTAITPLALVGCKAEPSSLVQRPKAGAAPSSTLSPSACRSQGGQVLLDPGDGSLYARGCPLEQTELARVRLETRDGLCCASASGIASPCTPGMDWTCNDDPRISSLWGRCNALGTCECNPGFQLSARGRCRPAP